MERFFWPGLFASRKPHVNHRYLRTIVFTALLSSGHLYAIPTGIIDLAPTPQQAPQSAAEKYYYEGLEHLVAGHTGLAAHAFRNSLEENPTLAKAMLGLAEVAFKENNAAEARRWIMQAVKAEPKNAHAQASLGRLLYLDKDFSGAERAFKKALSIDPAMISTRIALGDLYQNALKQPDTAIQRYRRALQDQPDHAGARYAMGVALLRSGDAQGARRELTRAAALQPDSPLPLFMLGNLSMHQNENQQALDYFGRVLALDPTNVKARIFRGDIFQRMGRNKEAVREYEAALKLDGKRPDVQLRLGVIHQRNQALEKARRAYKAAIELDPGAVAAYNDLAWMAAERGGDLDEALAYAKQAVKLAPQSAGVLDTLGWVYRARKEYPLAIKTLREAAALAPESATIYYHLGVAYMEQGNIAQGTEALNKVLKLDAGSAEARQARQLLAKPDR